MSLQEVELEDGRLIRVLAYAQASNISKIARLKTKLKATSVLTIA